MEVEVEVEVEADPTHNPKAVYDLTNKLNPQPFHATQAEIKATFLAPLPGTRSKARTFRISYPAWCNLRNLGRNEITRNMLITSGHHNCHQTGWPAHPAPILWLAVVTAWRCGRFHPRAH